MEEVLTAKEAAAFLRCSPDRVKRHARAGRLRGAKVGRQWRFRRRDLERWASVPHSADMTDLVLSNSKLVQDIRAADQEARDGRFLS
jgi:excisionase family DNA binding protein